MSPQAAPREDGPNEARPSRHRINHFENDDILMASPPHRRFLAGRPCRFLLVMLRARFEDVPPDIEESVGTIDDLIQIDMLMAAAIYRPDIDAFRTELNMPRVAAASPAES